MGVWYQSSFSSSILPNFASSVACGIPGRREKQLPTLLFPFLEESSLAVVLVVFFFCLCLFWEFRASHAVTFFLSLSLIPIALAHAVLIQQLDRSGEREKKLSGKSGPGQTETYYVQMQRSSEFLPCRTKWEMTMPQFFFLPTAADGKQDDGAFARGNREIAFLALSEALQ